LATMALIVLCILPDPRAIPPPYHMRNRIGRTEHNGHRLSMRKRYRKIQMDPLPILSKNTCSALTAGNGWRMNSIRACIGPLPRISQIVEPAFGRPPRPSARSTSQRLREGIERDTWASRDWPVSLALTQTEKSSPSSSDVIAESPDHRCQRGPPRMGKLGL
jgi:hypothetical protein